MYSHVVKGFTVGHLFTRRLLRRITSLPGLAIDALVAMFWMPDYKSYWEQGIAYADGTQCGWIEGLTGWVGEAIGFVLGGLIGSAAGVVVYAVDSVFAFIRILQEALYNGVDALEQFICNVGPALYFFIETNVKRNYADKASNLGAFIFGGVISLALSLVIKPLEYFLPFLGNNLSKGAGFITSYIGGIPTALVAIILYPPIYFFKRSMALYKDLRDVVRFSVAVIYGKTGEEPALDENDCCNLLPGTLHSDEFRREVEYAAKTSWVDMIKNGFHAVPEIASPSAPPLPAVPVLIPAAKVVGTPAVQNTDSPQGPTASHFPFNA